MNKSTKVLITILVTLTIVGCDHDTNSIDKAPLDTFRTICLNGVSYWILREHRGYQGYGYMSPEYNQDGEVVTCTR